MRPRFLILCAAALCLSGCASTMPGQSPTSSLGQLFTAIFSGEVTLTDTQIKGVTGECLSVAGIAADTQAAGSSALLNLFLGDKLNTVAGCVLMVTPIGETMPVEVVCPPKMAPRCKAFPHNKPVVVYATPIPLGTAGSRGQLLARRINDL